MNTAEILHAFTRRGITLYLDGEQLRYRAKPGTLTAEDKARIKANKTAILEALSNRKPEPEPPRRLYQGARHPGVPTDRLGLPFKPCLKCGCLHHWKDADAWRCSTCYSMPLRFYGETCTVEASREGKP